MWSNIETFHSATNTVLMRTHLGGGDTQLSLQSLCVGDGRLPNQNSLIIVDSHLWSTVDSIHALVDKMYLNIEKFLK